MLAAVIGAIPSLARQTRIPWFALAVSRDSVAVATITTFCFFVTGVIRNCIVHPRAPRGATPQRAVRALGHPTRNKDTTKRSAQITMIIAHGVNVNGLKWASFASDSETQVLCFKARPYQVSLGAGACSQEVAGAVAAAALVALGVGTQQ